MSSLSQQMTVRSSIAAFSIGTSSSSRPSVMTKPPTCWERWRGKPTISSTSAMVSREPRLVGVEPELDQPLARQPAAAPAPDLRGERRHRVARQPHGGADLADRPLAAVVDDGGADPGALAAEAAVDVLDHLLAALVLEVDVDVGRLVAGVRDEALEHHGADLGRHRGDAERPADDRVRRRPAPLAEDALAPRVDHRVVHGQEERRVGLAGDQRQLLVGLRPPHLGHPARIAVAQPLVGQPRQPRLRVLAVPDLPRVLVAQLVEREAAVRRDLAGAVHRGRVPVRTAAASRPPTAAAARRWRARRGRSVDAQPLADAGQHVDEPPAAGMVHDRLGRGDQRQPEARGDPRGAGDPRRVLAVVARAGDEVGVAVRPGEGARRRQPGAQVAPPGRQVQQQVQRVEAGQVVEREQALALPRATGAEGQQPAEPRPAGAARAPAR